MSAVETTSIGILVLLTGALFIRRPFVVSRIRSIFWVCAAALAAVACYQSASIYFAWLTDDWAGRFLLPPYTPIGYFLFYAGTRFILPYLLGLAFAGIAFMAAKYLNRACGERFFYPEEYYFLALGIMLTGHPYWLAYLILCALAYVARALVAARASLYELWFPLALATSIAATLKLLTLLSVLSLKGA